MTTPTLMTTFALSNAVNQSIQDEDVRELGGMLLGMRDEVTDQEFSSALYQFSAHLIAVTAELVTKVFLTEEEINTMITEAMDLQKSAMEDE